MAIKPLYVKLPKNLVQDPDQRICMGKEARQYALKNHKSEEATNRLAENID